MLNVSIAVLLSIQPKWCELIASGKKTVEVRKTRPKLETPFKVYIYQTKKTWVYNIFSKIADWQGKVIGEFVCNSIEEIKQNEVFNADVLCSTTCLTIKEFLDYIGNKTSYCWHISNLVIYDQPKELSAFHNFCEKYPSCDDSCEYYAWTAEGGSECMCDTKKPFIRPSQSWRYAEEV